MLNCDNGTYDAWYWAHPPIYMPKNCNLEDVGTHSEVHGYSRRVCRVEWIRTRQPSPLRQGK